ncbi:lipid A deacylase LpxR family protein [Carboxylicivirga taeanensis]|uniref:lipid A deacylase LpxR family protein n=1 Tax=Carboxylicivirga taeanensis TaxID=1416875 RepID=UPI003F6E220C
MIRKKRFLATIAFSWVVLISASSQQTLQNSYYQLRWDNDVFMMTDYYYTQGMSFTMYHPVITHNPLNLVLLKPGNHKNVMYGVSVFQKAYTPKDIKSDEIQFFDRPYAGVLVFSSHSNAANPETGWLLKAELDLGVMGPASGAGKVQYKYHDFADIQLPNGWHNQQYNWPVINYNIQAYKQLYETPYTGFYGKGAARIGTLHDEASLGLLFRVGKMPGYIESLGLPLPNSNHSWQLFVWTEPSLTAVAYNGTLMGGWHRNEKIHYIEFGEMNKLIGTWRTGLSVGYHSFGLTFGVVFQSKEFKSGAPHWYTTTRLFLTF